MSRKFGEESPVTFQVQKTHPHIVLRQLGDVRHPCNHWRIRRKRQMKPATHDCELTIERGVGCLFTASPRDVLLDVPRAEVGRGQFGESWKQVLLQPALHIAQTLTLVFFLVVLNSLKQSSHSDTLGPCPSATSDPPTLC